MENLLKHDSCEVDRVRLGQCFRAARQALEEQAAAQQRERIEVGAATAILRRCVGSSLSLSGTVKAYLTPPPAGEDAPIEHWLRETQPAGTLLPASHYKLVRVVAEPDALDNTAWLRDPHGPASIIVTPVGSLTLVDIPQDLIRP